MRGVLAVEDWAEIRRLHRSEGLSARAVARRLGVSRGAVARALASVGPPKYERRLTGSAVDAFEPAIRVLLAEFRSMPASVIAERVGWSRSGSVLRSRVAELRPLFAPPDPASRTSYQPGELVQCDLWFPPVDIPLGHRQVGLLPGDRGGDVAVAAGPGLDLWSLAVAATVRDGAESVGVGQRGGGRVVAGRPAEADGGV